MSSSTRINELDIILPRRSSERPFYTTGDRLEGKIVLRNPDTAFGVEATVKFVGVASTKIGARTNIHRPPCASEVTLFSFTEHLGTGSKSAEGPVWSFNFCLPSGTQSSFTLRERYSADQDFNVYPGHSLPPSFNGGARTNERDNFISYAIEATVSKPYLTHPFPGTLKCERSIPFRPVQDPGSCRSTLSCISKNLTISSSYLPISAVSHIDHARWASSTASKPQDIPFEICVHIPEAIVVGRQLPVFIGAQNDLPDALAEVLSPISLRNINISVQSQTKVRTPAPYLGLGQEPNQSWSEKTQVADSGPINIQLSEKCDVNEFIRNLSISNTFLPTFKTFNIARAYTLHTAVELECLQQYYSFEISRQITLLPATCRTEFPATAPLPPVSLRSHSGSDEPPPPYEEHEGAAAVALGTGVGIFRLPSFNTTVDAV